MGFLSNVYYCGPFYTASSVYNVFYIQVYNVDVLLLRLFCSPLSVRHLYVCSLHVWGACWYSMWSRVLQRMLGKVSFLFFFLLEPFSILVTLQSLSVLTTAVISCNSQMFVALGSFLNLKIQEGEAHNIFCPAYDCFQLVPVEVIESIVSREMDKRYLQFDIKV